MPFSRSLNLVHNRCGIRTQVSAVLGHDNSQELLVTFRVAFNERNPFFCPLCTTPLSSWKVQPFQYSLSFNTVGEKYQIMHHSDDPNSKITFCSQILWFWGNTGILVELNFISTTLANYLSSEKCAFSLICK